MANVRRILSAAPARPSCDFVELACPKNVFSSIKFLCCPGTDQQSSDLGPRCSGHSQDPARCPCDSSHVKPAPDLARVRQQLLTMPFPSTILSVLTCALLASVLLANVDDGYVTAPLVAARQLQSGSYSDPGTLNTTTTTTTTTTTGECGLCAGISCDRQVEQQGFTCEYMEKDLGCDCSWCDCPTDCFDVFDVENGDGSCAYYAENNFCNSYFCPDCLYKGQCDFSCSFGNCDTTTTTTKITTDIDTTTSYVSTTQALSYELIYSNVKETCNNVFKIDAVCTAASACTLRECWVCYFVGPSFSRHHTFRCIIQSPVLRAFSF